MRYAVYDGTERVYIGDGVGALRFMVTREYSFDGLRVVEIDEDGNYTYLWKNMNLCVSTLYSRYVAD